MAAFSIDKNNLPGVKEVCRDFAVLEDHCLAHNLQEQEIESHLASNVHKSRLVQQDLQVAKKLQEEEDKRAKDQNKKQHRDLERQDNEIAQEIQEELVRQAEWERQQEEKDEAIARKMQEKEMKEERKRKKQLEANLEEEFYEDQGAAQGFVELDEPSRHASASDYDPGRDNDPNAPGGTQHDLSPEYTSSEPKMNKHPRPDPVEHHSRSRYPEHHPVGEGGRGRHADPYPEHLLPPRGKHGDRYPEHQLIETARARGQRAEEGGERAVRRKEKPARPPQPRGPVEKDKTRHRERDYGREKDRDRDYGREKDRERDRERDPNRARNLERDGEKERRRDIEPRRDKERDRDGDQRRDKDGHQALSRSRERGLQEDSEPVLGSRDRRRGDRVSREEEDEEEDERGRRARGRQRVHSRPGEVFEEYWSDEGPGERRELCDPHHREGPGREGTETGRAVPHGGGGGGGGGVGGGVRSEFGLSEATQGLARLDLKKQELRDMEVARKLQEEEIKASKVDNKRAAQVAQDEEIARLLMEKEKKEYKKGKDRVKEKEREREKERRRPEGGDYRPSSEDVVRPRSREEHEQQRQRHQNKPSRPPQPRTHDYENVNSSSGYPSRPEAAYKGAAYYRQ